MHGREHIYWSLMAFSIFIFAFSLQQGYYSAGGFTWFALVVTAISSMIFNEITNVLSSRKKKIEKEKKNAKGNDGEISDSANALKKGMNLLETFFRIMTYFTMCLFIVVCVYVGIKGADHAYYVIFAYFCNAFGAIFPDFLDSIIPGDMRFHRDPWAHSSLFANLICVGCLLTVDYDNISLNLFAIAFLIGNTCHLLCDNIESGSTLSDALLDIKHWKECPGDIRKIREDRERFWINMHAVHSLILLVFITLRYKMTYEGDGIMTGIAIYDPTTQSFTFSIISLVVICVTLASIILTFIAFNLWQDKKKKKTTKKKKVVKIKK